MSHSGAFSPDADTLHEMYGITDAAASVIVRYLEVVEKKLKKASGVSAQRKLAKDALERVVEQITTLNPKLKADVTTFVMDSEAYGDEVIGYQIRVPGTDVYENVLAFLWEDNGFVVTDWGGEFEDWENEKYLEDPWPKIEQDGPQGEEDIYTRDFVTFYTKPFMGAQKGRQERVLFRLPLDPDEDPSPSDPGYWTHYYVAAATADEIVEGGYWHTRVLDYFWHEDYGDGQRQRTWASHTLYHPDLDADSKPNDVEEWEAGKAIYQIEKDLRARQGKLFLPDRDPNEPPGGPIPWLLPSGKRAQNLRYLSTHEVPRWGDLVAHGLFDRGEIIIYEVLGARVPMYRISRADVQAGKAWPLLQQALKIQRYKHGRTVHLWDARGPTHATWAAVNAGISPSLGGLRVKRRR